MGGAPPPQDALHECQYLSPTNQVVSPNAIAQLANSERFQIMGQSQIVANPAQTRGSKRDNTTEKLANNLIMTCEKIGWIRIRRNVP